MRSIDQWLKQKRIEEAIWVITDIEEWKTGRNVLYEDDSDRIVRYNPYGKSAYAAVYKDGTVVLKHELGLEHVSQLNEIYRELMQECE